jgi:hypothetical protein
LIELDKCIEESDCNENATEVGILDVILRGANVNGGQGSEALGKFT